MRRNCETAGHEQYLREIADTPVVPDQWQLEKLALVGLNHRLFFFTPGVSAEDLGALGADSVSDPNVAVQRVLEGLPAGARVVLIPEGPYCFARVAG